MFITLKRIFKIGFNNFFRNVGLSISTIFIIVMVVFLVTTLFLFNFASKILIADIEKKVDVSVYFEKEVLTENIMEIKSELVNMSEVREVEYVSKEQALEKFIERHRDDPVLMESLTEVGENPFLASLSIKANEAFQYENIVSFLDNDSYKASINKVDYFQRKPVIERLFTITNGINRIGITITIILGIIAVLIIFNTIRIAICNTNQEISVMKLVGASNWFVRGPFLIQGIISGIIATLIVLISTFGITYLINDNVKFIAPQIDIFSIFLSSIWMLISIQLFVSVGLGILSSMIAVRKYLKV
ncbi:MAG: permease-like cell division protein FtsX [Candidatus Nealsonbacteria bacterium]